MSSTTGSVPTEHRGMSRLEEIFSVFAQHPFISLAVMCICSACIFMGNGDRELSPFSLSAVFSVYLISNFSVTFILCRDCIKDKFNKYLIFGISTAAGLTVLIYIAEIKENISLVFLFFVITAFLLLFVFLRNDTIDTKHIAGIIILLGFGLRLTYILYTTVYERQHDNGTLGQVGGHLGYISSFWNDLFSLPKENAKEIYQYYHPPLHHFTVGVFLNILKFFGYSDIKEVGECIQYVTLFYSSACMLLMYKLLRVFNISKVPLLLGLSVTAFHPTFLILAGSVNNDMLSILLMLAAALNTVYYYKNSTYANIIKIALCVGLAMLSKMSGWMVAPAIAVVFIAVMIKQKNKRLDIVKQWVVFGVICVPLGLVWSIRCLIKYDMPLGYVMKFDESIAMYLGNKYTFLQRLTDFSSFQFDSVYDQYGWYHCPYYEYNPTIALFKTSMFDEAQYSAPLDFWAVSLFLINIVLALVAVAAMIYVLISRKSMMDSIMKVFFTLLYAVPVVSYYIFCDQYPFTCTMNIRYAVMSIFTGAFFLSAMLNILMKNNVSALKNNTNKSGILILNNIAVYGTAVVIILFSFFAVVTYIMIGCVPPIYDGVVLI